MANRLSGESSPYLLQHQNNPVHWQPWDSQALEISAAEDKPIFLSIGYSACHWCHVMEHESFENQEIAGFLNENFVSIKVDREERPDLDHIYMQAVMAMSGHGGWPLSAFLTPGQKFFFGGTYWPPIPSRGMPGFQQVLESVLDAYRNKRESIEQQAEQVVEFLQKTSRIDDTGDSIIKIETIEDAVASMWRSFDKNHGGFGSAPKFPHPMDLSLLTRLIVPDARGGSTRDNAAGQSEIRQMVTTTLDKMAYGGIFDHLAGGFARYSVDSQWLVPHFEKMLYDNALLANVYLEAHLATGSPFYKRTALWTLDYLINDMTDAAGGIHSTEDADSEGVEGKFYVWDKSEVIELLELEIGAAAQHFCDLYGVSESGNFEGKSILNVREKYDEYANRAGIEKTQLRDDMRKAREILLVERNKRIRPGKDDKVLVSWNALAINAFANAAIMLDEERFLNAAQRAARFILDEMRQANGRLLHTWRQGSAKLDAYLDDYVYLIDSLVTLYHADWNEEWIDEAVELTKIVVEHFADDSAGGFFFTADDHESLIVRTRDLQDSSVPSGNSMAACAFLRLGRLTGNTNWIETAESTMQSAADLIRRAPTAAGQMLLGIQQALLPNSQMILVADQPTADLNRLARQLQKQQVGGPSSNLILRNGPGHRSEHLASVTAGKVAVDGEPTMYVCVDYACQVPVVGISEIESAIQSLTEESTV